MNILIRLGSTESIKSFLINCPSAYAIISINALTKELLNNSLKVIEVKETEITRQFSFVTTLGAVNDIADKFMLFSCDNI